MTFVPAIDLGSKVTFLQALFLAEILLLVNAIQGVAYNDKYSVIDLCARNVCSGKHILAKHACSQLSCCYTTGNQSINTGVFPA